MDEQLLRVVLPTALLAEVDQYLAAEGSSRTRVDFVREAIEQRLLELKFAPQAASQSEAPATWAHLDLAPPAAPRSESPGAWPQLSERIRYLAEEDSELPDDPLVAPRSLAETRLPAPVATSVVYEGATTYLVEAGPLFLHGRDYPSLWALWWLVRRASEAPQELAVYLADVTALAWRYAASLSEFDHVGPLRVTTMFPRSRRNPDSASQTFQAAAIGGVARRRDGTWVARGPLPRWQAVAIWDSGRANVIAPTQAGLDLLTALDGVSLELPHTEEQCAAFLDHLGAYAPSDLDLLMDILALIDREPSREQLVAQAASLEGVDAKLADVYAQSYVARGREWGLVEPKIMGGRYLLTERGRDVAS
jgi:hypothetical protein